MICYLQGGIGNQMFQYAMAKAQAIKLDCGLTFNIQSFANDKMRQYSLGLWQGIDIPIGNYISHSVIREKGLPFNDDLLKKITPDSTLFGYWQTEKYFSEIKDSLKKDFTPRSQLTARGSETLAKIKEAGDRSVFLTIRRTDYVYNNFHGVLSMEYYDKALSLISEKINNPVVFIFSDEPDWCTANLKLPYETYVSGNFDMTTRNHLGREDEELWLMRHCKHAIMANSSYSWWGAWLGERDGSIIISPNRWFASDDEDFKDIVPKRWIKL